MAAIGSRGRTRAWQRIAIVLLTLVALAGTAGSGAVGATDTDRDGLRDGFERANGFDPERRDTDGDGVQDPAEDEDDDRLGALGEQGAGTSALLADSDEDGTLDGFEDADGDRVSNAREQDRRRLPRRLSPSLAQAPDSLPLPYLDHCHSLSRDAAVHPCVYGDATAATTVVMLGDSHAAQWIGALDRAGKANAWRIVSITKSGCPAAGIAAPRWNVDGNCDEWRDTAVAWIAANPPSLVMMASSLLYQRYGRHGRLQARSVSRNAWVAAVRATVERMPEGVPVVMLADTPRMMRMIPRCLADHRDDISRCSNPRARALSPATVEAERVAVEAAGGRYATLNGLVCPYDPCPALDGDLIIWRDHAHLTRRMSEALWRPVAGIVSEALAPPGPAVWRRKR